MCGGTSQTLRFRRTRWRVQMPRRSKRTSGNPSLLSLSPLEHTCLWCLFLRTRWLVLTWPTVVPRRLVTFEIHYNDRIGENYFAKYNPNHEWYLYPHLTRDEILLLKQWDSAGTLAKSGGRVADADGSVDSPSTFSFHSAIDQPPPPGAPDRESMEVRCVVIYDPPQPSSKL